MSPDEIKVTLRFYDRTLGAKYPAQQMSDAEYKHKKLTYRAHMAHCRWMAQRCLLVFLPTGCQKDLEKAMRWLGYIQGVCNAFGLYSCNELRDHSRGTSMTREEDTTQDELSTLIPAFAAFVGKKFTEADYASFPELRVPATSLPMEDDRYAALEKEHLGDPEKKTGIYHPDVEARRITRENDTTQDESGTVPNS